MGDKTRSLPARRAERDERGIIRVDYGENDPVGFIPDPAGEYSRFDYDDNDYKTDKLIPG